MSLTAIAFLLIFSAGCFLALGRHPIWGLLTYVGTFYLHPPARWWGESLPDFRWSLLSAVITLIAYLIHANKLQSNGSFFSNGIVKIIIIFIIWMTIQLLWCINTDSQMVLIILYSKYILLMYLIFRIIDTPENLKLFLWTHVAGCFVMGWTAYTGYHGGRFEGFAPPNVNEANAGALQIITGIYTAAALFFTTSFKGKTILVGMMPFLVNGVITTISRSAFIEIGIGGLIFSIFSPKKYKRWVKILTIIGGIGFLSLTSVTYWNRINTLKEAGESVQGVNTGYGRVVLMRAQWKMFKENPFGYGHRGTAYLSPLYLEDRYLTGAGVNRGRASHSTFMTMLAEHGVVGVFVYLYLLWLVFSNLLALYRLNTSLEGLLPLSITATAAILGSIFLGDQFVDYLKLEVRLWFLAILMVLPALLKRNHRQEEGP